MPIAYTNRSNGCTPTLSDSRALGPLEPPDEFFFITMKARSPEQVVRNVDFKKLERLELI